MISNNIACSSLVGNLQSIFFRILKDICNYNKNCLKLIATLNNFFQLTLSDSFWSVGVESSAMEEL